MGAGGGGGGQDNSKSCLGPVCLSEHPLLSSGQFIPPGSGYGQTRDGQTVVARARKALEEGRKGDTREGKRGRRRIRALRLTGHQLEADDEFIERDRCEGLVEACHESVVVRRISIVHTGEGGAKCYHNGSVGPDLHV